MVEAASTEKLHGWTSLNGYYDIARESMVGTVTVALDPAIPVSYFGFVDFSEQSFWMEQNLRARVVGPLHASFQAVVANALPDHLLRFGVLWKGHETPGLKDVLAKAGVYAFGIDLHLLQIDTGLSSARGADNIRRGGQIEPFLAGAIPGTQGRIFYEGWIDLDLDWPKDGEFTTTVVSDVLVGCNLFGDPATTGSVALVAEYRYNGAFAKLREDVPALRDDPALNPHGIEVGARYFVVY